MPKRTSLNDADQVEIANDLDALVQDKRAGWRASPAKARRRQRRYVKRMTDQIARLSTDDPDLLDT
ncbi:MAG: hypothetical protein AAF607_10355 [Pseudomonadota bacterium]